MPIALKRTQATLKIKAKVSPLMHLFWFGAAGLFVSILALTYGLDLSPGLF